MATDMGLTRKDLQWLEWAELGAAIFSTCSRRQYMAIIVDQQGHVLSTGYNGGPRGFEHCTDGGCPRAQTDVEHGSTYGNCIAIHAEANALLHSDYSARSTSSHLYATSDGVTLYINGPPCWDCGKLIANSGIRRVVCMADDAYADWDKVEALLKQANVQVLVEARR